MARVLIVYHMHARDRWLSAYLHSVYALRRYSGHECLYLNTARPRVAAYLSTLEPDLVVFHHTLLNQRLMPEVFAGLQERIRFLEDLDCPKILIAQDEQVRMDLLNSFINRFGVSQVFSPAPPATWPRVYREVDREVVRFHPILNGYVDDSTVSWIARRLRHESARPIDVGYRTWYTQPYYGSHGQLKRAVGRVFKERAPEFGLVTDISWDAKDALPGNSWFEFLLRCKYTVGVEGGCSVFDWDGAIAAKTKEFTASHAHASFDEIEAACFPGLDGQFEFYSLSPRHLEAIMTKTCQVLIEGEYGGVLEPGTHYIELKRDFSNLTAVLETVKRDDLRETIVERAYSEIVASGRYSYRAFVDFVLQEAMPVTATPRASGSVHSALVVWNQLDEAVWRAKGRLQGALERARGVLRQMVSRVLGEERLRSVLSRLRGEGQSQQPPRQP